MRNASNVIQTSRLPAAFGPSPELLSQAADAAWGTLRSHEWDANKWNSAPREMKLQLISLALGKRTDLSVPPAEVVDLLDRAASVSIELPPVSPAPRAAGQITTDTTIANETPLPADVQTSTAPPMPVPVPVPTVADSTPISQLPPCNPPATWSSEQERTNWMAANPHCPVPGMYVPPQPVYPMMAHNQARTFFWFFAGVLGGWALCSYFSE